jgi:Tfp pilus assembly ATPase PilU
MKKIGDYNDFDDIWLKIVEFIMTADFVGAVNINGALVKIRQKPHTIRTIAIWIRNDQQQTEVKRQLEMEFGEFFMYTSHKDQEQLMVNKRK